MKKPVAVAIDSGKFFTKGISREANNLLKRITFRTKMDFTQERTTSGQDSFVVSYKEMNVLLGKQAETVDFEKDKQKDIHKLAIYTAITQLVEKGDTINLAIGCPMDLFVNFEKREEFEKFILGEKEIEIQVNGEIFNFTIESVKIFPESSGIILKNWLTYRDKQVGVIDIGGLNINACVYDKGDYLASTIFTINKGSNILMNELKGKLNKLFNSNLQDWQMEMVIKDGFIKKDPEKSRKVIEEFLHEYVNNIVSIAKQNNWDIDNMNIVFIGGGSLLLNKYIHAVLPDAEVSKNAIWDNVEGFGDVIGI